MPPHSSDFHSMWTSLFQEFCIAQGLSPCVRSRPSGSDLSFSRPVPEILVFLAVRFPAAFFEFLQRHVLFFFKTGIFLFQLSYFLCLQLSVDEKLNPSLSVPDEMSCFTAISACFSLAHNASRTTSNLNLSVYNFLFLSIELALS